MNGVDGDDDDVVVADILEIVITRSRDGRLSLSRGEGLVEAHGDEVNGVDGDDDVVVADTLEMVIMRSRDWRLSLSRGEGLEEAHGDEDEAKGADDGDDAVAVAEIVGTEVIMRSRDWRLSLSRDLTFTFEDPERRRS